MDVILAPKNRFTWMMLSFQGGFVNIGGLITVHVFVSHVTGFSAHFAQAVAKFSLLEALYFSLVPLFFLFGSFFSSLFTEIRKAKGLPPVYIYIMALLTFFYIVVSLMGYTNQFGKFGEPFENFRDFMLLSILAFSCGAQNALFTHYSKSIIRTTHLTGLTTDLGIGLAKEFFSNDLLEKKVNRLRIQLILSFIFGATAGAFLFPKFEYLGFLLPAIISLIVALRLFYTRKSKVIH